MSNYVINLPEQARTGQAFRFQVPLSGVNYQFQFFPNVRDGGWYFHLLTAGGTPIACGIHGIVDYSLLSLVTDVNKPAGYLMLLDTSGKGLDPGPYDLGARVQIIYNDGV